MNKGIIKKIYREKDIKNIQNLEIKNGCDIIDILGENSLQQVDLYNKLTNKTPSPFFET